MTASLAGASGSVFFRRHRVAALVVPLTVLAVAVAAGAGWYRTTRPGYRLHRAREALTRDDVDGAARQALSLEASGYPDHAHLVRGEVLFHQRRYAEAVREFNQIRDEGSLRVDAVAVSGECLLYLKQRREAERAFRFVLSERPDDVAAHRGLAAVYYDDGAMWLALEHLEAAARLEPDDGRAHRWMGLIHKDLPYDNARAIACYEEALRRRLADTAAEEVREELAECLVKQSDYARALTVLEEGDPPRAALPRVTTLRAECLWGVGRGAEARAVTQDALRDYGNYAPLLRLAARLRLEDREPEAARRLLDQAVALDRSDYQARALLVQVYDSLGRPADAAEQRRLLEETKADLAEMTRLNLEAMNHPRDPGVRRRLADLCRKLDKPDLAAMWLEAAAACAPDPTPASAPE